MRRRVSPLFFIGVILIFGVLGLLVSTEGISAHAHLKSGVPAQDSRVSEPVREVVVTFTEPVELAFSTFKVYALDAPDDLLQAKAAASRLVPQVLALRNDQNAPARVDRGIHSRTGTSDEVRIQLREDLGPGTYVVMWRVLSIDTHRTDGFYVFTYKPE